MEEEVVTDPRSVSQVKSYMSCAHAYYLSRIEKVWSRPASWFSQGTAVHAVAEAWELAGRPSWTDLEWEDLYQIEYNNDVSKYAEETPDFLEWFNSGPYDGWDDIPRRYDRGLEQALRYRDYYLAHPEEQIAQIDGKPGVEVGFQTLFGDVYVRGYIDSVILDEDSGYLTVRDTKTGMNVDDPFQLKVYMMALWRQYGLHTAGGGYMMLRYKRLNNVLQGWVEHPTEEDYDEIDGLFSHVDEQVKAGNFPPSPSPDNCGRCSVRAACTFAV